MTRVIIKTYIEPILWAQKQFGQACLNDPRRTQRLVALAASLAEQPGVPVSRLIISPADYTLRELCLLVCIC